MKKVIAGIFAVVFAVAGTVCAASALSVGAVYNEQSMTQETTDEYNQDVAAPVAEDISTSFSSIKFVLSSPIGVDGYFISITDNNGFSAEKTASDGNVSFDELTPQTTYYFTAKSYQLGQDGEFIYSDEATFKAVTDALPQPSIDYSKSSSTFDTITIGFKETEGLKYRVRICNDQSFADAKSRVIDGGSLISINGLKQVNHKYYIRAVSYITIGAKTYYSSKVEFTYNTKNLPKPVVNFAKSNSTTSAVRIEFNKISGVNYRMKICSDASFADSKSRVVEGGPSLRFDNLARPNYTYYVRAVTYKTANGKRYYSAATEFTYKTVGNPEKPVVDFAKSGSSTSAVRIEFNNTSGVNYRMRICYDSSFADSRSRIVEGGSSLMFDDLAHPNHTYYIRAQAYTTVNSKRYSSPCIVFTYKTVGNPAKPTVDFAKSNSTTSAVRIEFNKISGVNYRMKICYDSSFADSKSKVVEGGSSLRFDNLARPNHTYYVRAVTYKTENGKRYYSAATEFTYKTVGNPAKPVVNYAKSGSSTSAVRLEFNKVEGINYRVRICYDSSFADSKSRILEGGSSLRFDDLAHPNHTYYIRAQAYKTVNSKRYCSPCIVFTYKTVGNPPKPIVDLKSSASSATAIRIEFEKASGVKYRMKICYDSSFADSKSRVVEGDSSLRFDNLANPNHTYYIRAVTYKTENGKRYYSAATEFTYKTKKAVGWLTINGKRYYYDKNGDLVKNQYVDGYKLSSNGAMTDKSYKLYKKVRAVISEKTKGITDNEKKLKACFDYLSNNFSYLRDDSAFYDGWQIDYAYTILSTGKGNCYKFASAFAFIARELGYDASVIVGQVTSVSGGFIPHGWVEIKVDKNVYVYDPDLQMELGRYYNVNFFKITYASSPVTYRK